MTTDTQSIMASTLLESPTIERGIASDSDIDRVRDLLFGSYYRESMYRFQSTERQISDTAFGLTERMEQEIASIRQQANQQASLFEARCQALEAVFAERLRSQHEEFEQRLTELQVQVTNTFQALDYAKLDQHAMADLFSDLASKMKQAKQ